MVNHVVKPYPKDHGFLTMVNHGFFSRVKRPSYTDQPVRDELARVKLDMTVCTVGHS